MVGNWSRSNNLDIWAPLIWPAYSFFHRQQICFRRVVWYHYQGRIAHHNLPLRLRIHLTNDQSLDILSLSLTEVKILFFSYLYLRIKLALQLTSFLLRRRAKEDLCLQSSLGSHNEKSFPFTVQDFFTGLKLIAFSEIPQVSCTFFVGLDLKMLLFLSARISFTWYFCQLFCLFSQKP